MSLNLSFQPTPSTSPLQLTSQAPADHHEILSLAGRWVPLPKLLYGAAIFPFNPILIDFSRIDIKGKGKSTHQDSLDPIDPSSASHPDLTERPPNLVPANPNQVPLEVGDECYVFEQYIPASHPVDPASIWYRGYVVNISYQPSSLANLPNPQPHQPDSQPFGPSSHDDPLQPNSNLPDEPQVFLGIFPASHLQIREHLEDSSHRSSGSFAQIRAASAASAAHLQPLQPTSHQQQQPNGHLLRSFSKESTPMEPLPEEDESDLITSSLQANPFLYPNQDNQSEKLSTPLPSLKAGDETISGRDEPLVDEIACALREWYTLLFVHLHRRRYKLFQLVKDQTEALHMGRRQLLAQTLSTEEAAKLRRDLVNRLVYGNFLQGLDIIVRHPDYGALVDSEVEIEAVDSRSWMSIIRMYVCQVKLAYLSPVLNFSNGTQVMPQLIESGGSNALSSISSNNQSKLSEPNQIPLNAHLPSLRNTRSTAGLASTDLVTSPLGTQTPSGSIGSGYRPKFYHMMLDIKSFAASPCAEWEVMELYFSLYNKSESRFLTEEFCIILNHVGLPIKSNPFKPKRLQSFASTPVGPEGLPDVADVHSEQPTILSNLVSLRTMFKDISPHDVQDSIFLVCRLIKNGSIKSTSGHNTSHTATMASGHQETIVHANTLATPGYDSDFNLRSNSFDGIHSDPTPTQKYAQPSAQGEYSGMTFINPRTGFPSVRRPYGCAVVELAPFPSQSNPIFFGSTSTPSLMSRPTTQSTLVPSSVFEPPTNRYTMNIFSPVSEANFPTLHEDIIASRTKEFFGSGNLTSNGPSGHSNHLKHHHSSQGSGTKVNESIDIEMRTYYGDTTTILKENSSILSDVPLTSRLGFPDVVYPDDSRNELYVKLWSGDFSNLTGGATKMISSSGSGKNIEVTAELRTKTGQVLERMISRGSGEPNVTQYNSMVYRNNHTPTWGELMKLDISSEIVQVSHLFFTFRNRVEKHSRNQSDSGQSDRPFAFTYLPLFSSNRTFIPDGEHNLVLFKYDKQSTKPEVYGRARSSFATGQPVPEVTPAVSKLLIPLKDSFAVRSFLCSTLHTQNEVLLKLMKWESLLDDPDDLRQTLTKLKFASEVEICKFLRNIFDALFGVLVSRANAETKEYDELVFNALVTLLGIVSDRRFTNFKPVVDLYIDHHFSSTTASTHLLRSFQNLLANPTSPDNAHPLRCSIKVWGYLMRFIVRSRELQRVKEANAPSSGLMSDAIESKFKVDISSLLYRINHLMTTDSSSIIGTQTLAVQHYSSLLTELSKDFSSLELLEKANAFCESIKLTKGKIVMWKLLLQEQIVMSSIFDQSEARVQLVPKLTSWVKPHLGEFEDYLMFKPQDNDAVKHSARVTWLEGIRIVVAVIAVALDKLHEVLIDPVICTDQISLAQEHDNVEYLLGLLPKLLDSFREFENPINVEIIQRLGTTASVISPIPIVFPATYPLSLLNSSPPKVNIPSPMVTTRNLHNNESPNGHLATPSMIGPIPGSQSSHSPPTVQNALGEIAVVMITMIMLAPSRMLKNYLELMLEVEGKVNFGKFLSRLFKAFYSILKNKAFPSNWLNINVISHKAILKLIEVVSTILQREFIPRDTPSDSNQRISETNYPRGRGSRRDNDLEDEDQFDSNLWSDFFVLNHGLLSSKQLVIEEFPPQKRRAIWKLAGDIRGEGSKIFRTAWESIGEFTITISHPPNDLDIQQSSDPKQGAIKNNTNESGDGENPRINEVTRCGGYQVQFVPGFIEPLLELCLSHHDELRGNAVVVLYSVIVSEFTLNRDFTVIADEIIDKLDNLLGNSPSENLNNNVDEMSRACFVNQLKALFDNTPIMPDYAKAQGQPIDPSAGIDQELKLQVDVFMESLSQFLELLLSIRNLPPGDEFIDDRVIGTLKLMSFIRNIGRSGIYVHYVHKLVNFHAAHGNFVEAGLALRLHADLHDWDLNTMVEAMPELSLPRQTAFSRKETLYFRILNFLSRGKAWESGIQICKELQEQYERISFDYERLSEVLAHQSSLYLKIVKTDRYFSEYFRVAFYGQGFPPSVQNRQFVYRGYEWEKFAAFCDRMHNKHPNAQIIPSQAISTDELAYAEGQFLQITRVVAEPDRSTVVFKNPEVSNSVVSYYENNATNTFSHTKPFNKDNVDPSDTVRMWIEKTFLVCEDAFPTVLRRSEILEIRVLEISPIENAILMTEQKTRELESLQRRYLALTKTTDAKLNTNPLSMALNSIVDGPANTGIPAYRNAFLDPSYLEQHPNQSQPVQILRQVIDNQTTVINSCLQLHEFLCPPEMKSFHATLHKFFVKNFSEEIARLPLSSTFLDHDQLDAQTAQAPLSQDPYSANQQNGGNFMPRSNSLVRWNGNGLLAANSNLNSNNSSGPSLSLSLGGFSDMMPNAYGDGSLGGLSAPSQRFQSGFNHTSSSSSWNPLSGLPVASPVDGSTAIQSSGISLSRSITAGSDHRSEMINLGGNFAESRHPGSMMSGLNSGGGRFEHSSNYNPSYHETNHPASGSSNPSIPEHSNYSNHNPIATPSSIGLNPGANGGTGGSSSNGNILNSNGLSKLMKRGTIVSGHSQSGYSNVGAGIGHSANFSNSSTPDRKSILGIRFGSRHK